MNQYSNLFYLMVGVLMLAVGLHQDVALLAVIGAGEAGYFYKSIKVEGNEK